MGIPIEITSTTPQDPSHHWPMNIDQEALQCPKIAHLLIRDEELENRNELIPVFRATQSCRRKYLK